MSANYYGLNGPCQRRSNRIGRRVTRLRGTVRTVAANKQGATTVRRSKAGQDQQVEWLTPAPDGTTVELAWPDADGPLLLTCHLASVDGRTLLVGLDVRSFRRVGHSGAEPGPQGFV